MIQAAAELGGQVIHDREFTDEECDARSEAELRLNLAQYLKTGYHGPRWTEAEVQLLGTLPDAEVARMIGKSVNGVRVKRTRLGVPTFWDGRKG